MFFKDNTIEEAELVLKNQTTMENNEKSTSKLLFLMPVLLVDPILKSLATINQHEESKIETVRVNNFIEGQLESGTDAMIIREIDSNQFLENSTKLIPSNTRKNFLNFKTFSLYKTISRLLYKYLYENSYDLV